jgi:membrane fusion protein, multidrug efflux system
MTRCAATFCSETANSGGSSWRRKIAMNTRSRCVCGVVGRAGLIALSILYFGGGCSPPKSTQSEVARPVKTMVVAAGGESHVRTFPGRVDASKKVELAFQVPGLLIKLPVKEGQNVAKGDVIAQLRQDEFQARLKTLQGQLDQARAALRALQAGERPEQRLVRESQVRAAEANLANARTEFDRHEMLLRRNAVSRADFDRAETAYRVAREELAAARQLLEKGTIAREEDLDAQEAAVRGLEGRVVEAKIQLDDTTLVAPYDGVIAQRFVEQNQNVRAKEPVVRFQDEEIEVAVDVPESVMAADIRNADILELVGEFSGAPGIQFPVHINEIAQAADATTQTFRVRVAMKAPPMGVTLLPGMTATVTVTYRRAAILGNRILVPISAVFKEATGEQIVWIIGPDESVSRRPVKAGTAAGSRIEIVDGLQPGERIAVAGVTFLREGRKVRDLGDALGGGQP